MNFKRTLTAALVAFVLAIGLGVVTAQNASANPETPYYVGSPSVCVDSHVTGTSIPVYSATHQWGDRNAALWITTDADLQTSCSAAGYSVGATLDVHWSGADDGKCFHWYQTFTTGQDKQYRTRTILYLNQFADSCWESSTRRAHYMSQAIGVWLGLNIFTNTTVAVMGSNTYDTVAWPSNYDIAGVNSKYWFWRKV